MLWEITYKERRMEEYNESLIHFLEYESDTKRGGEILVTLEYPSCGVLTRG